MPEYQSFALDLSFIFDAQVTSLKNLDLPGCVPQTGAGFCGEQNMVLFALIICALQYQGKIGQLAEELKIKAVGCLQGGSSDSLSPLTAVLSNLVPLLCGSFFRNTI